MIHRFLMGGVASASLVASSLPAVGADTKPADLFTETIPSPVIDDHQEVMKFSERFGKMVDDGKAFSCPNLLTDVGKPGEGKVDAKLLPKSSADAAELKGGDLYEQSVDSVLLIGSLYKCGRCDDWHAGAMATAWVAGEDGIVVTNYHVLEGKGEEHFLGIMTHGGKTYPVVDVLAADPSADVAILKVETEGDKLKPLALAPSARVGDDVTVISNPRRRLWVMSKGIVSRYFVTKMKPDADAVTQMSITADYAVGSSGGPLLNNQGEVIGMVSSTQTVHTKHNHGENEARGAVQMVFKDSVPVAAIRALVSDAK